MKHSLLKTTCLALFLPLVASNVRGDEAANLLHESGVQGGLIVHLDCGDARLTGQLHVNERFVVQGLTTDVQKMAAARNYLREQRLAGPVSIEQYDGRHLPYSDQLVNLVICTERPSVPEAEIRRVLCPGGVLLFRKDRQWVREVKKRPATIDDWSHFLHDASNNPVAADHQVGPPRGLRWTCGPRWSRSHEFNSSLCAMVSDHGRIFYIFDEGLTSITGSPIPDRWTLTARDAFNGVLLWRRHLPKWGPSAWKRAQLRNAPATIARLLVANGNQLFVPLGYGEPLSVLDAATGEVLSELPSTRQVDEFRVFEDTLIARVGGDRLLAIDLKSNSVAWETRGRIRALSPAVTSRGVFYQDGTDLVCRQVRDGTIVWKRPIGGNAGLLVAHKDRVFLSLGKSLEVYHAVTGELVWSQPVRLIRPELFIARDRLWHWETNSQIVGRDLDDGEVTDRPDTRDVFTPGHHLRCYQSKATEDFLITPNRGAEFVSLTGQVNTESDWLRAACRFGVMPCNGLLYSSPHPCLCNPGVMLTGFNALSPASNWKEADGSADHVQDKELHPLFKGPAYRSVVEKRGSDYKATESDWPTYRHDDRRTGSTAEGIGSNLKIAWKLPLQGPITPPVVAGSRAYLATKDEHTVHAIDLDQGDIQWSFTAGGRIDSPPSVYGDLVLFGSADGYVYCLRARDGQLAWQLRAAPMDRRMVAEGQLESPWRVHGSVLVTGGLVYATAGRSTFLDGGIWVLGIDPIDGRIVHQRRIDTWSRTRQDSIDEPFIPAYHMEGARSDVLTCENDAIYLGQLKMDRALRPMATPYVMKDKDRATTTLKIAGQPFAGLDTEPNGRYEERQREWLERTQADLLKQLRAQYGAHNLGDRKMGRHVLSTSGFLDDSWFNRTFWMYSDTWPGYYLANQAAKTGQLLVVGPERTYAVRAYSNRNFQSPLFEPGKRGYLLLADSNNNEPVLDDQTRGTTKGWGYTRARPPDWFAWVPVRMRALVLAGDQLFAAGPPDIVDSKDPLAAFEGRTPATLRVFGAHDGKPNGSMALPAPPVLDGMIAARGRLLISTTAGEFICLAPR